MSESVTTHVLVVEDGASEAQRLQTVLESAGYRVVNVFAGGTAWSESVGPDRERTPDVVLLPALPEGGRGRENEAGTSGRDLPVLAVTALQKQGVGEPGAGDDTGRAPKGAKGRGRSLVRRESFVQDRRPGRGNELLRGHHRCNGPSFRLEREGLGRFHQFLQSTLDSLSIRIAILDAAGTVLAVNAAWNRFGGVDPLAGLCNVGENYLVACESSGEAAVAEGIREVMSGRRDEYTREYPSRSSDGRRWFYARVTRFADADSVRVVVAHEEVTPRKAAEEQLLHEAYHDALTGLPNRALFSDRLARAVSLAKWSDGYRFVVLFLDLDEFKVVNDSLGHTAGDQLLMGIARRIEGCVRKYDTVARLGGDEFAILVNGVDDILDALRLVERVQKALSAPFMLGGHEVFTSASIGIAASDPRYDRPVEMLRDADTAVHRAKALGKARYVVFNQAMHTSVVNRLRLETDLRRGLERQEFWVAYQPIVELEGGRVSGLEALARWQHPERGPVAPAEFIPAAEASGLIVPLDLWVIREACRQAHAWRAEFPDAKPLVLSVNLSCKQFAHPTLIDHVDSILADTGIDPQRLRMEITESAIVANPEAAAAKLRQIRRRGITLSMDDFGTGYSSLSYLHQFPFDMLKIDRSFVSRIGPHGENSEITAAIIALAHSLHMKVVAEGVETPEQAEHLRGLGCHYGQGYHFSKPLAARAAADLLARSAGAEACTAL